MLSEIVDNRSFYITPLVLFPVMMSADFTFNICPLWKFISLHNRTRLKFYNLLF